MTAVKASVLLVGGVKLTLKPPRVVSAVMVGLAWSVKVLALCGPAVTAGLPAETAVAAALAPRTIRDGPNVNVWEFPLFSSRMIIVAVKAMALLLLSAPTLVAEAAPPSEVRRTAEEPVVRTKKTFFR